MSHSIFFVHRRSNRPSEQTGYWSRLIDRLFRGLRPWQIMAWTLILRYFCSRLPFILGAAPTEPLARYYNRNYFRATWLLTALDAGYFTAKDVRPKWLRSVCAMAGTFWYLAFSQAAEEKVKKYRATATVALLRLSWEKATDPIIRMMTWATRIKLGVHRVVQLPRTDRPDLPPITVHLYFDGTEEMLKEATSCIFQVPGGGFISMSPENHYDAISRWCRQTKLPFLSLNYHKAPEFAYPYAVEECLEAWQQLHRTQGAVFGISDGTTPLRVAVAGDSAGANIGLAMCLKILALNEKSLTAPIPMPTGIMLIYACLNFEMGTWITPNMAPHIPESTKPLSDIVVAESPVTPRSSLGSPKSPTTQGFSSLTAESALSRTHIFLKNDTLANPASYLNTNHLAMSSRVAFFADRVIPPIISRSMALFYLGPNSSASPATDMLLSPVVAPRKYLAKMPPTYIMCGEKDPFVDDSIVWANRLREATGGKTLVKLKLFEGLGHAFFQMVAFLPEAHDALRITSGWFKEMLADPNAPETSSQSPIQVPLLQQPTPVGAAHGIGDFIRRSNSNAQHRISSPMGAELLAGPENISMVGLQSGAYRQSLLYGMLNPPHVEIPEKDAIDKRRRDMLTQLPDFQNNFQEEDHKSPSQ